MKSGLFLLMLAFFGAPAFADDISLCSSESPFSEDVRMDESAFTRESAEAAGASIGDFLDWHGWERKMAVGNRLKIIRGFILRDEAVTSDDSQAIARFCKFMTEEAFYLD